MSRELNVYPNAAKILRENLDKTVFIDEDEEEVRAAYEIALNNLAEMYVVQSLVSDYLENKATAKETILQIIKLTRNGERT